MESLFGQNGFAQRLENGRELCTGNGAQRGENLGSICAASGQKALAYRPFHSLLGPASHLTGIGVGGQLCALLGIQACCLGIAEEGEGQLLPSGCALGSEGLAIHTTHDITGDGPGDGGIAPGCIGNVSEVSQATVWLSC